MSVWIISDTHFGHANIIDYEPSRRAWCTDIESHDRAIIEAWRAVVRDDDEVLHCGDFSLCSRERSIEIARQLPGVISLVLGNHDRGESAMEAIVGKGHASKRADFDEPGIGRVIARHAPSSFDAADAAWADVLIHGHMHGHVPGINDAAPDRRHAYPSDQAIRVKLMDASIEALPTAPGPMLLSAFVAHCRASVSP